MGANFGAECYMLCTIYANFDRLAAKLCKPNIRKLRCSLHSSVTQLSNCFFLLDPTLSTERSNLRVFAEMEVLNLLMCLRIFNIPRLCLNQSNKTFLLLTNIIGSATNVHLNYSELILQLKSKRARRKAVQIFTSMFLKILCSQLVMNLTYSSSRNSNLHFKLLRTDCNCFHVFFKEDFCKEFSLIRQRYLIIKAQEE